MKSLTLSLIVYPFPQKSRSSWTHNFLNQQVTDCHSPPRSPSNSPRLRNRKYPQALSQTPNLSIPLRSLANLALKFTRCTFSPHKPRDQLVHVPIARDALVPAIAALVRVAEAQVSFAHVMRVRVKPLAIGCGVLPALLICGPVLAFG